MKSKTSLRRKFIKLLDRKALLNLTWIDTIEHPNASREELEEDIIAHWNDNDHEIHDLIKDQISRLLEEAK